MRKKEHIVRSSAKEIKHRIAIGESKTDWDRVKSMPQTEVERLANDEEGPLPEGWEAAVEIGVPEAKEAVHIRLDKGVLRWFKAHGPGYQTRINAVLKAFIAARQRARP